MRVQRAAENSCASLSRCGRELSVCAAAYLCVLAVTEDHRLQGFGALLLLIFVSAATTTVMGHMEDSSSPDGRELALALQAERSLNSMRPVGNGSSLAGGAALRRACMAAT